MRYFLILLWCFTTLTLSAQNTARHINTTGIPLIRHYESSEYNSQNQNWSALQDSLGIMYFGNNGALLTFDGSKWKYLLTENGEAIRSLAKSDQGVIYYGSINGLGYLSTTTTGELKLVSLSHLLPPEMTETGVLYYTTVVGKNVFFQSESKVLRLDTEAQKIYLLAEGTYFSSTKVENQFFVTSNDEVLVYDPILGLNAYGATDSIVKPVFVFDYQGKLAVLDRALSVHLISESNHIQSIDLSNSLSGTKILKAAAYKEYLLIATVDEGLYIYDKKGEILQHFDKSKGLGSDNIYGTYIDNFENLWVTHANGISHVEWFSPYTSFDDRNGLVTSVVSTKRVKNRLYTGTFDGLYQMDISAATGQFQKLNTATRAYWFLLEDQESIIVGRGGGIDKLSPDGTLTEVGTARGTVWAMDFNADSSLVLAGSSSGDFYVIEKINNTWVFKTEIPGVRLASDFIINKGDNEFWMSNSGTGVFRLTLTPSGDSLRYEKYGKKDGFPSDYDNRVYRYKNDVLFAALDGIYTYDAKSNRFLKDSLFSSLLMDEFVFRFVEGPGDKIWYHSGKHIQRRGFLYKTKAGYQKYELPGYKLQRFTSELIVPFDEESTFIAAHSGLLHINTSQADNRHMPFQALINEVRTIPGDSLLAGVYYQSKKTPPIYEASTNSFRFSSTANFYENAEYTQYQWRLIGYENEWSTVSFDKVKDYTNLSHGSYRFEVRAINVFGTISAPDSFSFEIKAPWYLTWWAYCGYFTIIVSILVSMTWFNARRLKRENIRLENVVEQRTKEIRDQKEVIEQSLAERESLLKEIHHRVKNNLQIIASLLYLQSGKFENEDFKKVLEEGQGRVRSMALIHQKLYENDDLKSIPFDEYLSELVGEIRSSFGMEMEKVKLDIQAKDIYFDVEVAIPLGLIVNELATNAFKYAFTDQTHGSFSIYLTRKANEYVLNVTDDGKGIPDEINLKKTKSLGLRLVRMLSQQLEGDFDFTNSNGTSFELKFAA